MQELRRQWFHLIFGVAMLDVGLLYGKDALQGLLLFLLAGGLVLAHLVLSEKKYRVIEYLLEKLDRPEDLPGKGALTYVTGMLLAVSFASSFQFALGVIGILAFGDACATMIGRFGMHKLPFSNGKTVEGFGAFVISSIVVSSLFMPTQTAVVYSLLLGIIEAIDLRVDDNISIPAFALAFKAVLKA